MEIMRHVEVEKAWMRKSFTSLDVSGFPSLDECREQAGLTGQAAPAASDAAAPAAAPEQPHSEAIDMSKPTNPAPKPETEVLPEKPTSAAPGAPLTSLPTTVVNLSSPVLNSADPASQSPLMLDFSSLNFSDSGMNLGSGSGTDVTAILNGESPSSSMDFSSIPSFDFSSAPDLGSGSGMSGLLSEPLNLTLPSSEIVQSSPSPNAPSQ